MDATTARGKFQAVPQTLSDGEEGPIQIDNTGAVVVTSSGGGAVVVTFDPPSTYNSIASGSLEDSDVVNAAPATVLDVNGFNASASVRFFQLFNTVAVPGNGATPFTIPIQIPAGVHFSITFADGQGQSFDTGVSWASSTTQLDLTLTGAPDMIIEIGFRV